MHGIRQDERKTPIEDVPDRLPIYARRFHGHVRASRTFKPLNQFEETLSCRRKTTDPSRNLAFFDKSQEGHYLHLVYVQSRAPPK
jgi:hypothetical protein